MTYEGAGKSTVFFERASETEEELVLSVQEEEPLI